MKKQQGDVIVRSINGIPKDAKKIGRTRRGIILAEGEATGHAHRIEEEWVTMYEKDGQTYLRVEKPASVIHEEHKPISLAEGCYVIGHVREFDPFEEETRRVVD